MMIDFGDSVNAISQKTGLSESTIRRRVRLTKLDRDKLKTVSTERQITMTDLDRLFDIEDEDKRNKLLESIGTTNFEYQLRVAKDAERVEAARARALPIFDKLGIRTVDLDRRWTELKHVDYIDAAADNLESCLRALLSDYGTLYFEQCYNSNYRLWTPDAEEDEKDESSLLPEDIAKRERDELKRAKIAELRDKFTAMHTLRREWVENYTPTAAKRDISQISSFLIKRAWGPYCGGYYDKDLLVKLADPTLKLDPDVKDKFKVIKGDVEKLPEYYLFLHVYVAYADGQRCCFDSYKEIYQKNETLADIYAFLCACGYEMSDEEISLLSGKHPIYKEINDLKEND